MSYRIYIFIYFRWFNRGSAGESKIRYKPARYLLCCGPFPLCSVYGSSVFYICGGSTLMEIVYWHSVEI